MNIIDKIRNRLAFLIAVDRDKGNKLKIAQKEPIRYLHRGTYLYISPEVGSLYHIKHSTPKLDRMVKFIDSNAKVILDVGAHSGIFSKLASIHCENAQIYAFEPNRDLHKIIELNNNDKIHLQPVAVGSSSGEIEIFVNPESSQSSSVIKESAAVFAKDIPSQKRVVAITTIDDFCSSEGLRDIDAVKIDVQGHEMAVLEGAQGILSNIKTLFLEASFLDLASIEAVLKLREIFPFAYAVNDVTLGADIVFCQAMPQVEEGDYYNRIW